MKKNQKIPIIHARITSIIHSCELSAKRDLILNPTNVILTIQTPAEATGP
jgi:hypothetical protein